MKERPKERPILFSGPMVRAILEGRKTQTRRVIKPQPQHGVGCCNWTGTGFSHLDERDEKGIQACLCKKITCPYLADRLWVRETFADVRGMFDDDLFPSGFSYRCDHDAEAQDCASELGVKWKPSIHMPRVASRIMLEVAGVRVERLQDISEEDAIAEGIERLRTGRGYYDPRFSQRCGNLALPTLGSECWPITSWQPPRDSA